MNYEGDSTLPDVARVASYPGVGWSVLGWQTEPDQDTEWSGYEVRTGAVVCQMIGDDRHFAVDPDDLEPLDDLDYCAVCGQIGCAHDGRDRGEA
jgi:hypothetical protein